MGKDTIVVGSKWDLRVNDELTEYEVVSIDETMGTVTLNDETVVVIDDFLLNYNPADDEVVDSGMYDNDIFANMLDDKNNPNVDPAVEDLVKKAQNSQTMNKPKDPVAQVVPAPRVAVADSSKKGALHGMVHNMVSIQLSKPGNHSTKVSLDAELGISVIDIMNAGVSVGAKRSEVAVALVEEIERYVLPKLDIKGMISAAITKIVQGGTGSPTGAGCPASGGVPKPPNAGNKKYPDTGTPKR